MRDVLKAKGEKFSSKTNEMKDPVVRDSKCTRNIEKFDDLLFLDVEALFGCYRKRRRVIKRYHSK